MKEKGNLKKTGSENKCINCGKTFSGNSEKIFCSAKCKSEFSKKDENLQSKRLEKDFLAMKKNAAVLEKLFNKYEDKPFPYKELAKSGFVEHCPVNIFRNKEGISWMIIGIYAFTLADSNENVNLRKVVFMNGKKYA